MVYIEKAILDSVQGANANREDLSNVLSMTDGPPRPVTQAIEKVAATNTTHQWNEQGLNQAGRVNVAGGGPTYAQGGLPPVNYKAMARKTNVTCRVGRTAQVTDDEMAAFNGGGSLRLAEGETERLIQNALDASTAFVTLEVLNQIEWMHIMGDQNNATMEGGETDGLLKFATQGGYYVTTGGTSSTSSTAESAVNFAEQFIRDGARGVAQQFPSAQPNTLLVPPEVQPDLSALVAAGASRPLVQVASGDNIDMVAGASVGWYNTGYSILKIKEEPYLSPYFNSSLPACALIAYNENFVKMAELIKFGAEALARTDTSVKRMVTSVFAQEHRVAKHTFICANIRSSVA